MITSLPILVISGASSSLMYVMFTNGQLTAYHGDINNNIIILFNIGFELCVSKNRTYVVARLIRVTLCM
jgi:hypothetical protein